MGAGSTSRKINVLAVDDLPANLVALEAVLAPEYNLVTAKSGAEAISLLEARKDIGLILMDLLMPEMDGFEAAARIKKLQGYGDIPIIFITAVYKDETYVRKGYEAGAVDYFTKPFDPEILKRKVAIFSSYRAQSSLLKEWERQIAESEELLKAGHKMATVLESLPVGVLIADSEGRICQTNDAVAKILKSRDPLERDAYGEILGWWDSSGRMIKDTNGPLARALERAETSHNDIIRIQCFDGTWKLILGSASPLFGVDNRVVGAVIIIQDVTETKKIEEDMQARVAKLVSIGVELEQTVLH
ncbi:MAG: response regulator [Bdellovibrionota bacterium]